MNIVELDRQKCIDGSIDIFLRTSGLFQEGKKFDRMRKRAFVIKETAENMSDIHAMYEYYNDVALEGRTLHIKDKSFECNAFEMIDPERVKGAYVYAITAGTYELDEAVIDQVYADIWGNAFTDSARYMLRDIMAEGHTLSDSFGPGFYGMDITSMVDIDALIKLENIGIELRDERIMVPLKSCAGMFLDIDGEYEPMNSQCLDCKGNTVSCSYCMFGRNK